MASQIFRSQAVFSSRFLVTSGCAPSRWRYVLGQTTGLTALLTAMVILGLLTTPLESKAEKIPVEKWILDLGDSEYVIRERARKRLLEMGLEAFDALFEAKHHPDVEVQMQAESLLGRINFKWASVNDPPVVQGILKRYEAHTAAERKSRIVRLAELEVEMALPVLCRVVRFEKSNLLSKFAALKLMQRVTALETSERLRLADELKSHIGESRRDSGEWVRAYANTLVSPRSTLQLWSRLVDLEISKFKTLQFRDSTSRELVSGLIRWRADVLLENGLAEASYQAMGDFLDLVDGSHAQIVDAVDWLIEREAWSVVDVAVEKFPRSFSQDGLLLYRVAESYYRQGNQEQAELTANKASSMLPHDAQDHIEAAVRMHERGFLKWAETEYQRAMAIAKPNSASDLQARFLLVDLMHDHHRNRDAADLLKEVVDAMDVDESVTTNLLNVNRLPDSVRSQMHLYYSFAYKEKGDQELEMRHLEEGIEIYPSDPDLLIAMYHVEAAAPDWKDKTNKKIDAIIGLYRDEIQAFQRQANEASNAHLRAQFKIRLAQSCNQVAWLVCNTTGDLKEAIQISQQAMDLRPGIASYFDTLARCHWAAGEYEKAVEAQQQAVKLEPQSRLFKSVLHDYQEKALAPKSNEGQFLK